MWPDIQGAGVNAVMTALKWAWKLGSKGGKDGIQTIKGRKQEAEIAAQTAAATQPNLPPQLASSTKQGVVFGKWAGQYLVKPEHLDGHVMIVGGSGSGKSSCMAIPTLRTWKSRVFAVDIKGELYEKTKAYRRNIKVFNPLDPTSYGYDPFHTLRRSDNPAQEARAIAQAVIPLPHNIRDPFWIESAQNIFTAAILHFSAMGHSFLDTVRAAHEVTPKTLISALANSDIVEARYVANSLLDMEDKTLSGIMAELSRHVVVFITDKNLMSALTRKKIILPADLEHGQDVYIQIPEHLLNQWKSLLGMMTSQFMRYFEQRTENAEKVLFMLDEFPRLGKIESISNALATLRSKGVSICLILQSLAQLDEIYGKDTRKVIADNCAYQAILSATDGETQKYFSDLVGTYDRPKKSYGKQLDTLFISGRNESISFENAPIIKPEAFRQLGDDVIALTPYGFCRVDKEPYYREESDL